MRIWFSVRGGGCSMPDERQASGGCDWSSRGIDGSASSPLLPKITPISKHAQRTNTHRRNCPLITEWVSQLGDGLSDTHTHTHARAHAHTFSSSSSSSAKQCQNILTLSSSMKYCFHRSSFLHCSLQMFTRCTANLDVLG